MTSQSELEGDKLYDPELLPGPYKKLLASITQNVRNAVLQRLNIADGELWDGEVFQDYVDNMRKDESKLFLALAKSDGLNYQRTFKKTYDGGLGEDTALKFFCLSAQAQDIPLIEFIGGYVHYCDRRGFSPRAFVDHEKLIKDIREKKVRHTASFEGYIDPFKPLIQRLTSNYFQREKINTEISKFIEGNDKGYFLLRGEAGTGKSSIFANLVSQYEASQDYVCAWHFNVMGAGSNTTKVFLKSIYQKLAVELDLSDLYDEFLKIEKFTAEDYGNFLISLLSLASNALKKIEKKSLILLVDGLDEISPNDLSLKSGISNLHFIPSDVPEDVYLILSSRNDNHQYFHGAKQIINLDYASEFQKDDVREFILSNAKREDVKKWMSLHEVSEAEFVELIFEKSECRFIYVSLVLKNIAKFDKDDLPVGLSDYYEREFRKFFVGCEMFKKSEERVLSGLISFGRVISLPRLAVFSGLSENVTLSITDVWEKQNLVSKYDVGGVWFFMMPHLSFYEYIQEQLGRVKFECHSLEPFRRILRSFEEDVDIVLEDSSLDMEINVTPDIFQEMLVFLPDVLLKLKEYEHACDIVLRSKYQHLYISNNSHIENPSLNIVVFETVIRSCKFFLESSRVDLFERCMTQLFTCLPSEHFKNFHGDLIFPAIKPDFEALSGFISSFYSFDGFPQEGKQLSHIMLLSSLRAYSHYLERTDGDPRIINLINSIDLSTAHNHFFNDLTSFY